MRAVRDHHGAGDVRRSTRDEPRHERSDLGRVGEAPQRSLRGEGVELVARKLANRLPSIVPGTTALTVTPAGASLAAARRAASNAAFDAA